ncbi:auxilin-like protein 1 isoform X1 [Ziziphus jujuba]|uniref:Auxilin-like protein 1 isoform X1 n=1 Tax=Ziziphus jujuba TaxID=326968 RepID=A0A6P4A8I0_ZIZJJ|nr:auxilin-like protein 1 isoform X1 [Ziziphus jujuba]
MDNLSHSRQPNRGAVTLSKKICNNGGGGGGGVGFAVGKSLYDDVYGGPPKFGVSTLSPRMEDYSEIFGAFHASRGSAIPVLDLPAVDETEVFFDVRSSGFDYDEIFGGFDGIDFAISYEDLVDQPNRRDDDSSEEAWSAAESESLSGESDLSGKDQWFSNGSPNHDDACTEFSISYHKANQRNNEDKLNGMAHVTQLHAVRGFTCVVDEITTSQQTADENPTLKVADDKNLNLDFGLEMQKEKHLRKSMPNPLNGYARGQAFENELILQGADGRNGSSNKEAFVRVAEISLRTQPSQVPPPSRPPPVVEGKKGDPSKFVSNYDALSSEGTSGCSSPSFFDVEIDASSSAAASAAAIKEAMEKAQAKLRSAKELMEKKKDSSQSSVKLASKKDIKEKEGKVSKTVDESNRIKHEKVKGNCERDDGGKTSLVREERPKVRKTAQEASGFLEGEQPSNASLKFVKEKLGKESGSSKVSSKIDEASEWKEATQFFELVTTDESRKAFEQANGKKILVQNTKLHEHGPREKAAMETLEQQSENDRKVKAVRENHELKELEQKKKVAKEPCGWEENIARLQAAKEAGKQKDHEKKIKITQEICILGESDKSFTMAKQHAQTKKKIAGTDKSKIYEDQVELKEKENQVELKEKETKFKGEQAIKHKKNERKPMEADKLTESENRLEQSCETVDNKERKKEALGHDGNEKRLKKSFEQALYEKQVKTVHEQEENERLREVLEKVENEKRLKEALLQQVKEESIKEALEQEKNKRQKENRKKEENEKRLKEAYEMDDYEKILKFPHGMDDLKKSLKAFEKEDDKKRSTKAPDEEARQEKLQEAFKQVEIENLSKETGECEETEEMLKDAIHLGDLKGLNKIHNGMNKDENCKEVKLAKKVQVLMEEDLGLSDEACEKHYTKNFQATQLASNNDKITGTMKAPEEAFSCGENRERTEPSNNERLQEVVEMETLSVDKNLKASTTAEENLEHEEYRFRMDNTEESLTSDDSVKKGTGEMNTGHEGSGGESGAFEVADVLIDKLLKAAFMAQGDLEQGKNQCIEEDAYHSLPADDSVKAGDGSGIGQLKTDKTKGFRQVDFIPENQEKECNHGWKGKAKNLKQDQDALNQEGNKDKVIPTPLVKECLENKSKPEATQPAMVDGKQNNQKSSQHVGASQTTERKEKNAEEPLMTGEKETERMKRQRELEDERLRKIEEEKEREREREKDRMAVDLAKLEARERAYAEARERAERAAVERATAEARQRAMSEARERLEKACAEAREKSLSGKAAMEARLRAERAAVERATAEARERAAEKAMAERAAYETRERVQRSVSDKFSASSRNNGMRQSSSSSNLQDVQFQSTGGPIYSYASVYSERYEGVEGESAQRCRARLERHRRTADRAAKALAEKNMRDLLAQREQAERNRIAETLDADVRRWSSGKEGNLRALLSTLQYILGPDSGWQPIPLTEVITAAAVKKAYRKATLCVHPDKLQQRGANIQQKYICEKVFDLLKEAWNKFNSEER